MPLRCPHGATLLPCATVRCYCSAIVPHDAPTTPKVASVINVPPHAQSRYSSEGMALASLDQDEVLEDDFQTQHTPVPHIKWRGDSSSGSSARKPGAVGHIPLGHRRRGRDSGNSQPHLADNTLVAVGGPRHFG